MIALWLLTGVLAAQGGVEPPEPPAQTPVAATGGGQKKRRYDPLDPRSVRADIEGPPASRRRERAEPGAKRAEIAPDQPLTLATEIAVWAAQLNEARQVRQQVMRSQLARAHLAFDDMTRQLAELDDEQALVLLIR